MKLSKLFSTLSCGLLLSTAALADTYNWGGGIADTFLQSAGGPPVDGTFWFELGTFGNFTPTSSNVDQWAANWHIFDRASSDIQVDPDQQWKPSTPLLSATAVFDDPTGHTTKFSTLTSVFAQADPKYLNNDGAQSHNFAEQQAYIWVFNSRATNVGASWGLFSSTLPEWTFPALDPNPCNCDPINLNLADLDISVLGPPVTQNPPGTTLTLTVVPEPGSAFLLLTTGLILIFKRKKRMVMHH